MTPEKFFHGRIAAGISRVPMLMLMLMLMLASAGMIPLTARSHAAAAAPRAKTPKSLRVPAGRPLGPRMRLELIYGERITLYAVTPRESGGSLAVYVDGAPARRRALTRDDVDYLLAKARALIPADGQRPEACPRERAELRIDGGKLATLCLDDSGSTAGARIRDFVDLLASLLPGQSPR